MNLVFHKGSTLVLTNGETSRELLVSDASLSQTYLEESRSVRTLHSPNHIKDTYTNSKSPVSVSLTFNLTPTDTLFLEWLGFYLQSGRYYLDPFHELDTSFDLYLKRSGAIYKVTQVFATTASFGFNKTNTLQLIVDATASDWTEVTNITAPNLTVQSSNDFMYASLELTGYSYLAGFTLELTKSVSWINNKSVADAISSSIYTNKNAILDDIALGGSITNYKRDSSLTNVQDTSLEFKYGNLMTLYLSNVRTFDRWETSEVDKKITDYKVLPHSSAYIQF